MSWKLACIHSQSSRRVEIELSKTIELGAPTTRLSLTILSVTCHVMHVSVQIKTSKYAPRPSQGGRVGEEEVERDAVAVLAQ